MRAGEPDKQKNVWKKQIEIMENIVRGERKGASDSQEFATSALQVSGKVYLLMENQYLWSKSVIVQT